MMYAWPIDTEDKTDLSKRIDARDHHNEIAECPLHGCTVISRQRNGVWQWCHENSAATLHTRHDD